MHSFDLFDIVHLFEIGINAFLSVWFKTLYRISGTDKNGYFLCLRETAVALHLFIS